MTTTRREQVRNEVREKILTAAREILVAEGIDGLSMRKLASRIGYTATAIYFHFADKNAVIQALMDEDCLALVQSFSEATKVEDPVERLRLIGMCYVRFAIGNPNHYWVLAMIPYREFVIDANDPRRSDPSQDSYAFLRQSIEIAIQQGCFRPEYSDVEEIAQMLWATVHGIVSLHLTRGADPWFAWRDLETTANHLVTTVLRGMTTRD
ncbi:TetR/AcrR family transcriptional regulator [Tuwongella immobilis]|uniref:HTH tetR-type domain-containing protein n=1 Tax=Tuwongella immobilis TaxID=692036 RepID=A0A6C2YQU1_9BACT|nr:TetR/AcrR family transcriptional regulator [Tuwongella immobilis]VIP03701.1 family transcriptional regulator : Transcriptional regulator, TetR family OS=Koribacter versatilis (strain Ellin345) GN=Acid345_4024 PE=4 SV=1: TetR_N: WHG [Tuwongella immobilis]VTS04770.1 family transcriptional regulator : Transcriptional regulator, TetR family OS=Koribacter versatilis (strain Ellin345) GN=Acid345_4024 PE=4 SV=1: TetR_N: WHG [Tuwongella immobilis]